VALLFLRPSVQQRSKPHTCVQITCLDSTQKRVAFVDYAAREAGIPNVRAVTGRCEELGHSRDLRGSFDVVTARAVARMAVLAELGLPFSRCGGILVAAKGPGAEVSPYKNVE
jgi:16S rRNA (guanine527-N7)-methyltransferase